MSQQQFENFTASSLYCEKCKAAMPVRERLLLILPDKEVYDYLCTGCASSVGSREVTAGEKLMAQSMATRRPRRAALPHNAFSFSARCASPFIGTGEIGVPALRWLLASNGHELVGLVTQPDKPVGRAQRMLPPPHESGVSGHQPFPSFSPTHQA